MDEGLVGFGSVPSIHSGAQAEGAMAVWVQSTGSRGRYTEDDRQFVLLGGIMRCPGGLEGEGHLYPVWPSKSHGQAQHQLRMGTLRIVLGGFHITCQKHGLVLVIWGGRGIKDKDLLYPFCLCHLV